MQLVYEVLLLSEILRNHLLSENMQWNYASFNVTLNYLIHEIIECWVTSSSALDNWEQKYCQTLGHKPNHSHRLLRGRFFPKGKFKLFNGLFHSVYLVFPKSLFSIANLFAVRFLWDVWDVCNEDKRCVVTQRAVDIPVAWFVYVSTYCVPIPTLKQNKRFGRRPNNKQFSPLESIRLHEEGETLIRRI